MSTETTIFSRPPYFDDYDEQDNFYRVLFRPSYAVQTRELNQLQAILQKQIETHGRHIFTEGSMVIPGNSAVDLEIGYVKVQGDLPIAQLVGHTLTGQDSGISAYVVHYTPAQFNDPDTLFVKYVSSGDDSDDKTFLNNEVLLSEAMIPVTQVGETDSIGTGSIASIEDGYFFAKGTFVRVPSQILVLDKYGSAPSYRIGLDVKESVVTPQEDPTLNDNAAGSFNFAAPGAHRYRLTATLVKKELDSSEDEKDFVQLMVIDNGVLQSITDVTSYSQLERTLARRTYDQAGDYTVRSFEMDVREYRNNFRGDWTSNTVYLAGDIVCHDGRAYTARLDGTSSFNPPTVLIGSTNAAVTGVVWTYTDTPKYNRGVHVVKASENLATQLANQAKLALGLEPGKAYVRGYEISKIATEYVVVPKARDTQSQLNIKIPATVGNYVVVNNLNSLPDVTAFPKVDLYSDFTTVVGTPSGTKVGEARIRSVEFNSDTVIGTPESRYRLSLFDIRMNDGMSFTRNVKQFHIDGGSADKTFTADVFPVTIQLSGSISADASVNVTGTATLFNSEVRVGDFIMVDDQIRKVDSVISNSQLTVDSALTVDGLVFGRIETRIREPENGSLLYQLTYPYVKSVRNSANQNNTSYSVIRRFTQASVITNINESTITLSVSGAESFGSPAIPSNYVVMNDDTGELVAPTGIFYGATNKQVIIVIPTDVVWNYIVLATVAKAGVQTEKTKTLQTETVTFADQASATKSILRLGKADGYRLLRVNMDTGTFAAPTGEYEVDITDRYVFDNGQKSTHYDIASITLSPSRSAPTAPIQVTFEYFSHSATGDHFTVNSYLSTISYDQIPSFDGVPLAYYMDFRPRVGDDGVNFIASTLVLKRGFDIETDFEYYVSRADKVALGEDGAFFAVNGTPDLIAAEPANPSDSMVTHSLKLTPYTYSTKDVSVTKIDNRRYTMRDIGRLEQRIENIEYYTALSMLEQDASSLEIQDEFGLNRFKNGFVVDNFTGHNIGNTLSPDYICSIDMEAGELRPFFYMDNLHMTEKNTTDSQRASDAYRATGDLITLPYSEETFIVQPEASAIMNVNPFAVFTFIGSVSLLPATDEWFEVHRLPDIVTTVEGNFSAIRATLEASGALGTVWNSWQTQWTGTRRSSSTRTIARQPRGWPIRQETRTTTTTTSGQSRTGMRTTVVPLITSEVTDDRVVGRAVIPFIRSRSVVFVVRGLKPRTTFTPFFDGVTISELCTPATQIWINANDNFDTTSRAGGDAGQTSRLTQFGPEETAMDRGDVLFVKQRGATIYNVNNSPATAVLALSVARPSESKTILHVVNVLGTFQVGDVVEGSISGETSTITDGIVEPTTITSNMQGDVVGLFNIPNTDALRFRTGSREFKLSDDPNDGPARTSLARGDYIANGILETRQAQVTATRNAEVRREAVSDNRVISQTRTTIQQTGWVDPLAQTFMVESDGGAFLTSIDLYFATKDPVIPVRVEIREVVNGYPGSAILPFSQVSKMPNDVVISSELVTTDEDLEYPKPVPTTFTFPSPVYVQNNTEYCVVVLSDSNNYNCWISDMGKESVVSNKVISEQPYLGSLFKSQNASTWTADQFKDLMFLMRKAKFTTSQFAEIDFINPTVPRIRLSRNPIQATEGTTVLRVYHENHGFFEGAKVVLSGVVPFAGIPDEELNKTHVVQSVEFSHYIIHTTTPATHTATFGGENIMTTKYMQYNVIDPIINELTFEDTQLTHFMRTVSGKGVHGFEEPYVLSPFFPIESNANNQMYDSQMIVPNAIESEFMGGEKSIVIRCRMISENENVSPVIDTERFSVITVRDKIDFPTEENTNIPAIDTRPIVSANTLIGVSSNQFVTADADTQAELATLDVGKYLVVSGFAEASNNGKFLINHVAEDGSAIGVVGTLVDEAASAEVTFSVLERFVSEIVPVGSSSSAKYVSKVITFEKPSTFLKVRFAATVEQFANVDLYYKVRPVGSNVEMDRVNYTLASPERSIVKSDDGQFFDVEYNISGLDPYDALQCKLVMNSNYGSDIVRIKDLVIMGCA